MAGAAFGRCVNKCQISGHMTQAAENNTVYAVFSCRQHKSI